MMKKAVAIRAPKWDGTESFLAVFAVRVGGWWHFGPVDLLP